MRGYNGEELTAIIAYKRAGFWFWKPIGAERSPDGVYMNAALVRGWGWQLPRLSKDAALEAAARFSRRVA